MFDWLRKPATPNGVWNVAPSPDHTYVVFADDGLAESVAPALAELDAALAATSRETHADLADDGGDDGVAEAFDDEGKIRALIASVVTIESIADVDVDAARAASADPAAFANATSAVRVTSSANDCVERLLPYALLAVAAAIARHARGAVSDTLCRRVLPPELVAHPLAGLAIGSAGPHVTIAHAVDADGTLRFTTLGLGKYGIFEVTLGGVPAAQSRASEIVAAFIQSVVEPFPPAVPGPWTPQLEYVTASYVRAFYGTDGVDAREPTFTKLRACPDADPASPWSIANERRRPLGAIDIAAVLRTFDADRAAAIRESAAKAIAT